MLTIQSDGSIIISIGNIGNSNSNQVLKLFKNGMLYPVLTSADISGVTATISIPKLTTEGTNGELSFVNGILIDYTEAT